MKIYLIFLIIFVSCKSSSQSGYHKVLQTDFEPESLNSDLGLKKWFFGLNNKMYTETYHFLDSIKSEVESNSTEGNGKYLLKLKYLYLKYRHLENFRNVDLKEVRKSLVEVYNFFQKNKERFIQPNRVEYIIDFEYRYLRIFNEFDTLINQAQLNKLRDSVYSYNTVGRAHFLWTKYNFEIQNYNEAFKWVSELERDPIFEQQILDSYLGYYLNINSDSASIIESKIVENNPNWSSLNMFRYYEREKILGKLNNQIWLGRISSILEDSINSILFSGKHFFENNLYDSMEHLVNSKGLFNTIQSDRRVERLRFELFNLYSNMLFRQKRYDKLMDFLFLNSKYGEYVDLTDEKEVFFYFKKMDENQSKEYSHIDFDAFYNLEIRNKYLKKLNKVY